MKTGVNKIVENIFFFAILGTAGYLVWKLLAPFAGALALAAIVVTICYPLHTRIIKLVPNKNETVAAFASLFTVIIIVVTPLAILASLILREALSIYTLFNSSDHISFVDSLSRVELFIQRVIPNFSFDIASIVQQTASFIVDHLLSIFAGTASTFFLFFISLIATFYFFRDGKYFTQYVIQLSPLKDIEDARIIERLATAVRSVALGIISIAIIQGIMAAIGLTIFGFDRAILWGCLAAIGALIPGVGTTIVIVPSVIYLFYTGSHIPAFGLALWGLTAVGLVDNLIGPHLMSRGNDLHPFLILLSVLGGITFFGPVGFILGPVILSFFLVLLEIYHENLRASEV